MVNQVVKDILPKMQSLFKKYKDGDYFVETGTFWGNGIYNAIEAGYTKMRTVEVLEDNYNTSRAEHVGNDSVTFYFGSSSEMLWDMIKDIDTRITFWLDAHQPNGPYTDNVVNELDIIQRHPIKNHFILIDDSSCIDMNIVKNKIKSINSDYKVFLDESWHPQRGNDTIVGTTDCPIIPEQYVAIYS